MISNLELTLQLCLAAILGGFVGLERERRNWYAGLRTHMLVCIGATLIMIVSQYGFESIVRTGLIVLDPSRIAAQVVSGIGFLGAGTILFWKNKIKGLTTAASLWSVAAVGLAVGGKLYLAAIIATALIFFTLSFLKSVEKMFFDSSTIREIKLYTRKDFSLSQLDPLLKPMKVLSLDIKIDKIQNKEAIYTAIEFNSDLALLNFMDQLKRCGDIETIEMVD